MINTVRLIKVGAAWMSIIYVICFAAVALIPGISEWYMRYALHTSGNVGANVMTMGTFVSGLIIWNVITLAALWIFASLWNSIKK